MRTILIVDDQPSVLSALAYLFGERGYTSVLAGSGPEALARLDAQRVDVALIDLHMPGMDGLTVCRAAAELAREWGRALPIWLMAAAYTSQAATKAVEAGARRLVKKPFDTDELASEIEAALAAGAPAPAKPADPAPAEDTPPPDQSDVRAA